MLTSVITSCGHLFSSDERPFFDGLLMNCQPYLWWFVILFNIRHLSQNIYLEIRCRILNRKAMFGRPDFLDGTYSEASYGKICIRKVKWDRLHPPHSPKTIPEGGMWTHGISLQYIISILWCTSMSWFKTSNSVLLEASLRYCTGGAFLLDFWFGMHQICNLICGTFTTTKPLITKHKSQTTPTLK